MKRHLERLKGRDNLETAENYCVTAIILGVIILSLGIGLNAISTKGATMLLAMFGAVVSFLATIALIVVWVIREFKEK